MHYEAPCLSVCLAAHMHGAVLMGMCQDKSSCFALFCAGLCSAVSSENLWRACMPVFTQPLWPSLTQQHQFGLPCIL